ncbi:discoidin domain-containing protein [Leptospira ognonensis]|uniref:Discoidin domain-containing protein n=1 Tax=Leptospira ognonensis TaxID=2484945 RepID=A0A4V6QM77_9LEPT|nr:discoidin domain-containing protein [Leptospira ognonensis]TGL61841.1 discoidin domain-containing protein [Leptospira ognonensis]
MKENLIRVSHPYSLPIRSVKTTGQYEVKNDEFISFFEERDSVGLSSIVFEFEEPVFFNGIELLPGKEGLDYFPDSFRFELSHDGKYWEPILQESAFRKSFKTSAKWLFSLTSARYVKFVSKISRKANNGRNRINFGNLKLLITGVTNIQASSELDRLWVKENLIDTRPDYGWSSKKKEEPEDEYLIFDLGSVNRMEEIRMLTKNDPNTNFPERFIAYYSEDDLTWHQLHEENNFLSEAGTWYKWRVSPVNLRFLKLVFLQEKQQNKKEYVTEIIEIEFFSSPDKKDSGGPIREPLPYASVLRSGIIRLAVDGEVKEGVVVQSNDRRLRDASTEYRGIVELASDGEEKPGVVVQGNDKRLKIASELTHGLVRLGRSGEARPGLVVQSDDERLRIATTEHAGIVELAEDGETRPGVVVQGNDSRLKLATKKSHGLVQLAELGEVAIDKVVTGDDPRLKDATATAKGIVKLSLNGAEEPDTVVQANDKRLKHGTTEGYGIVQLAHSGENKPGVVVQGNDKRIQPADFEKAGIVVLSKLGENTSGKVVTADDPRLSDMRAPVAHTHDYAEKLHSFDSHTGLLRITAETSSPSKGHVPPVANDAIVFAKNTGEGTGVVGIGNATGLVGFSEKLGILGISKSKDPLQNAGVLGVGTGAAGGHFVSQSSYAVFANGMGIQEKEWLGSGKAIHALGDSLYEGNVRLSKDGQEECIARFFRLDQKDVVTPGDLLVGTEESNVLSRSKHPYSTNVIGVCVGSANLIFGKESKGMEYALVAFLGLAKLHVDASQGSIIPGDLLVSGLASGHAIKADPNKLKPGMLVAKALEPIRKDKGTILCLLALS